MRLKKDGFIASFKKFLLEGNALSLAVGVIIGGAMKDLVNSLVSDIFSPIIGLAGQVDFSEFSFGIGNAQIKYGAFITQLINFIILAFIVFLIVYSIQKITEKLHSINPNNKNKEEVPTTKVCPFCFSEINIDATRCPHCTSTLDEK